MFDFSYIMPVFFQSFATVYCYAALSQNRKKYNENIPKSSKNPELIKRELWVQNQSSYTEKIYNKPHSFWQGTLNEIREEKNKMEEKERKLQEQKKLNHANEIIAVKKSYQISTVLIGALSVVELGLALAAGEKTRDEAVGQSLVSGAIIVASTALNVFMQSCAARMYI